MFHVEHLGVVCEGSARTSTARPRRSSSGLMAIHDFARHNGGGLGARVRFDRPSRHLGRLETVLGLRRMGCSRRPIAFTTTVGSVLGHHQSIDSPMPNPVIVVEYDPRWPQFFEVLRRQIAGALGHLAAAIEHVGSTAVPGLSAKPIIDIDVLLASET